ncbi:uncharacterized protein LOC103851391 isoform X2 [Brassica rapa]|uniref:uncharacterized protein LOC103851391 isoform X2 n=1 Tax=Brassica campestris TaxID=3711 RepID=UPI00142D7879|nr:uncharacterized protein LOC103851391 isoform X2 [Brassica rapa]
MALSFASLTNFSKMQSGVWYSGSITPGVTVRCCETAKEPPPKSKLQVGSPIIIVEAPKVIKTAASMPCLRANTGLVKPGDVGSFMDLITLFIIAESCQENLKTCGQFDSPLGRIF